MNTENNFMIHNHIKVVSVETDEAKTSVVFDEMLTNYYGYFHGGLYFSMADAAAGLAARSNGENYVTLNANISFMIAVNSGVLTAHAVVISRTNKICVINVDIFDEKERCVNRGTYTMYRVR